MKTLTIIPLLLLHKLVVICISKSSPSDYGKFGVKTSYFENENLNTTAVTLRGCEPAYFWFLARHGTSNPRKNVAMNMYHYLPYLRDKIVTAWEDGNGQLDEETVQMFKDWSLNIRIHDYKKLTASGEREHEELGSRWRRRLDGLFDDKGHVLVRATNFSRTRESARYFVKGVFQTDVPVPASPELKDDLLLSQPLPNIVLCPKWLHGVRDNNVTFIEQVKLERSKDYKLMLKKVGDRVGLKLPSIEVKIAWEMCRFEMAWWPNETSPWCLIYSQVYLRLMEFRDDVVYYYLAGYGNFINEHMTQPIFEDIFLKFQEIEEGKREYKAALYFDHDITILAVLTALGLYQDEQPLLASNWPKSLDYQWRTSYMASFAANLGLVLLDCDSEGENRWKVMAYHQERPVILPACGQEVCTLQQFKQFYGHWTGLDFQSFCHL